jgi:hypothetical protein
MKKYAILLIALFVLGAVTKKHHRDHDENDEDEDDDQQQSCGVYSGDNFYDLGSVALSEGAWDYTDAQGNTFYFNFCGYVNQGNCASDSSVCIATSVGNSLNAGSTFGDWTDSYSADGLTQLTGVFINGEICTADPTTTLTTVIQLTCSDSLMEVYNTSYTGCGVLIQAMSSAACITSPPEESRVVVFPFFFAFICTLSLCLCCLTCCFRSRRAKMIKLAQKKNQCKYTQVPQQVTIESPKQVEQIQMPMPYYYPQFNPSIQNPTSVPFAYYQPPMNGGYMYPQFMHAVPQAPTDINMVPMDFASNSMEASRLAQEKEDARLARELQEKFNKE